MGALQNVKNSLFKVLRSIEFDYQEFCFWLLKDYLIFVAIIAAENKTLNFCHF